MNSSRHAFILLGYFVLSIFACHAQSGKNIFGDMRARSIGPALMSGRITDIDVVNNNPQIIFIGTAGGGLWKSVSAGTKVDPVFDDHTMSIGKVTIDQKHPDTVWVGTGEPWVRNSVGVGTGLYKSVNGGVTWNFLGLKDSEHISDIVIDPRNSNTVYIGAQGALWNANSERGVYKTTDGGKTFERILFIDENTGCADMDIDPSNPDIIYAAMWSHRRYPDFFDSGFTGTSGLYKSIDGGKSWKKIHTGLPESLGRIGVSVAPSNPKIVYASIEAKGDENKGLYKSWDKGEHWIKINSDFNNTVRPFYFSRIVVSPTSDSVLVKCAFVPILSTDGGKKFRTLNGTVHSDIHAAWINPHNPNHILLGTDGGVYESHDQANSFRMWMNLPVGQFYHVAVDNETPYNIYGGLQDGASWYGPSNKPGGVKNGDWTLSMPGDGFNSFAHPQDHNIVYAEIQGGGTFRLNKKTGETQNIKPLQDNQAIKLRFNWNTPLVQSPASANRIYTASQFVHVSDDRGDSWRTISPDLTSNNPKRQRQHLSGGLSIDNSTAENNTTISALTESPIDQNLLWVGSDDGYVHITEDGGKNWLNVTQYISGLPSGSWCSYVTASRFDKNVAYASFDNHRSGDKNPYIYKTSDRGKTWTSIAISGLEGFVYVIKEDLVNKELLFAGTEFGLFISINGGTSWYRFENNLPRVAIHDLVVHPKTHDLVLATHGRSIYIIDDISPIRELNQAVLNKSLFVFPPSVVSVSLLGGMGNFFGGDGNFVGEPLSSVPKFYYFMNKRQTLGKMSIKVFNPDGTFLKELTPGKNSGINMIEMVTRKPKPKIPPTENLASMFGGFGPPLDPGKYRIEVRKDNEIYETFITLQYTNALTEQELKVSQNAIFRIYAILERLSLVYDVQENILKQAEAIVVKQPKLGKEIQPFIDECKNANAALVFKGGDFYVNQGMRLTERVLEIYSRLLMAQGATNSSLLKRIEMLEQEMESVNSKFDNLCKTKLNQLNKTLVSKKIEAITLAGQGGQ